MDQALAASREAADRENVHRRLRRRYSATLRQQAVEYWQQRRRHEGVRAIAAAWGVSANTLQRWTRRVAARSRFRWVEVRQPVMAAVGTVPVVITMTADGVEGLTVETAARFDRDAGAPTTAGARAAAAADVAGRRDAPRAATGSADVSGVRRRTH